MKEITYKELQELQNQDATVVLIDVREAYEHKDRNIGGINIPMSKLQERLSEVPKDRPVVLYCRSGARSAYAINALESSLGYTNLINLKGGIISINIK